MMAAIKSSVTKLMSYLVFIYVLSYDPCGPGVEAMSHTNSNFVCERKCGHS